MNDSGDLSGETTQNATSTASALLSGLGHLFSLQRPDRFTKSKYMRRLADYSEQNGLTAPEAERAMAMALRSGGAIAPRDASQLIRCIRPAPGVRLGEQFVLAVLGSLGGDAEHAMDLQGLADPLEEDAVLSDEVESDIDEPDTRTTSRRRRKKGVDIRIQAYALRLLLQLHSPPRLSSRARSDGRHVKRGHDLPSSFLTPSAHKALDQCYGVLFHYIDYQTLRAPICHLLCLTTRRKHVRHYRITKVLSMRTMLPADPYVNALLHAFAFFYPDLLFAEAGSSRAGSAMSPKDPAHGLRYPQIAWLISVQTIWSQSVEADVTQEPHDDTGRLSGKDDTLASLLPPPTILMPTESRISISEIVATRELGYKLDKVTLPDQLATSLQLRMALVAILGSQEGQAIGRDFASIYEWVLSALEDHLSLPLLITQGTLPLKRSAASHKNTVALINAVRGLIDKVGCCDYKLQSRLARLFDQIVWRKLHREEREALLGLVQYFIPKQVQVFDDEILSKLEGIAKAASDKEVSLLLIGMATMFERWSSQDWHVILRKLDDGQEALWGTSRLTLEQDHVGTIAMAVSRTSQLANEALCKDPSSILLLHACLSLHEVIFVDAFIGLHDLLLPPALTLYLPAFTQTGSIMALARQFGIVHNVRQLHQDYLAAKAEDLTAEDTAPDGLPVPSQMQTRRSAFYDEECSDRINDCVILLIDLIWRNNGFVSAQNANVDIGLPLAFFRALDERCQSRGDELQRIGSASHSATLAVLMEAYANDLVRERGASKPVLHGPLNPAKLKDARRENFPVISHRDFRDSFLSWLARQGARGVGDLLNSTITRFIRGQEVDQSTVFS